VNKEKLLDLYLQLFAGRPDVYAIRSEWTDEDGQQKSAYIPSVYTGNKESVQRKIAKVVEEVGSAEYTQQAVRAHIYGEQFLGVYPLHADSTVKFFALDFDGESPDEAWAEALRHYRQFTNEAHIPCYLEVSRSGNGFHLWAFLDQPLDAGVVRRAVKSFINKSEWFDRMFPNQNRITELRPLGNLIAMPLYGPRVKEGKSCFIDPETREPYPNQTDFLTTIERVSYKHIENLAALAPELPEDRDVRKREGAAGGDLPGINKVLDSRFGCEWIQWQIQNPEAVGEPEWYALACNLAQLKGGRDAFHEISRLSVRYSPRATDAKFDQAIEKNAPHSCEYIRDNLNGTRCACDTRFPGRVYHPFDLGRISAYELIKTVEGDGSVTNAIQGLEEAFLWAEAVEKDPRIGQGIPYGFPSVDQFTGLRNSTVNILAARPSIGKTAFALDVAHRAADNDTPVYFFSLEMSRQQLWRRLLCRVAGVSATKMVKGLLTPAEWQKLVDTNKELRSRPRYPFFVDDSNRDIRKIMEVAYQLQEEHGKGIVMIDYLGLLDWYKGENEYAGNTRNSKETKLTAKALDCPVLLLHQFNRQGDDMGIGAECFDSWLRSTGQIEQDADVILYLLGERGHGVKERELVIQKERDREAGHRIMLEFNQSLMQFGPQGTWYSLSNQMIVPESLAVSPDSTDEELAWAKLDDETVPNLKLVHDNNV
jgi:KaiC/GvpD/RAD55 family RecA-like ATPase